jgi:hypothetical protein
VAFEQRLQVDAFEFLDHPGLGLLEGAQGRPER